MQGTHVRTATLLSLGALLGSPVAAQTPLLLRDAESRVLAHHPEVLAAQQRLRQAESRTSGARAQPSLELDIGHGKSLNTIGAANTDQDILLTQRLALLGQISNRTRQARAQVAAAHAELRQVEIELTFRVRTAWFGVQTATAEAAFARQDLTVAQTFVKLADAQYRAGDVPIASVLRSQIEAETVQQSLSAAETRVQLAAAALNTLLQIPADRPLTVAPLTEVTLQTFSPESLQSRTVEPPQIRAAQAAVDAQRAAVGVAQSARLPDLVVQYAHNQIQTLPGGDSVRVGLVLPLVDHGQIRASVREAQAAAAEKEALLSALRQDIAVPGALR